MCLTCELYDILVPILRLVWLCLTSALADVQKFWLQLLWFLAGILGMAGSTIFDDLGTNIHLIGSWITIIAGCLANSSSQTSLLMSAISDTVHLTDVFRWSAMQSHGVLSKSNSVSCIVVGGLHCQQRSRRASVCSGEFPQCKCSGVPVLSSSNSRLLRSGLQSSFVSRTSHLLVPNPCEGRSRRVKRGDMISPRAMVATASEVAEVGHVLFCNVCWVLCQGNNYLRIIEHKWSIWWCERRRRSLWRTAAH